VIALLVNPNNSVAERVTQEVQQAARAKGLQLHLLKASNESEIDSAFASLVQLHVDALVVAGDPFLTSRREQFAALASHQSCASFGRNASTARKQAAQYVLINRSISCSPPN